MCMKDTKLPRTVSVSGGSRARQTMTSFESEEGGKNLLSLKIEFSHVPRQP